MVTDGRQLSAHGTLLRRARLRPSARRVVLSGAVIVFFLLCVPPVVWMLGVSFAGEDGLTAEHYRRFLMDACQRELLLNSTLLGAGAAALSTLMGAPAGLLLVRAELPLKQLLRLALAIPLVIPPYILALAWTYFGGATSTAFGRDLMAAWTYSLTGAVIILGEDPSTAGQSTPPGACRSQVQQNQSTVG